MKNTEKPMCHQLDAYFDGELDTEESRAFQEHLAACKSCRTMLADMESIRTSMQVFRNVQMPDETDLRIRQHLHTDRDMIPVKDEILDIEAVARFLKITVTEVVDILDRLPSFEVGGRIRFRRERIIDWIRDQEKKQVREREQQAFSSFKNIVQFPGGKP